MNISDQITSVTYSRLVSFGDHENERLQASARVEGGQSAEEVLANLKTWIVDQLSEGAEAETTRLKLADLKWELREVEQSLGRAKQRWDSAREFLAAHGLDVSQPVWELPF